MLKILWTVRRQGWKQTGLQSWLGTRVVPGREAARGAAETQRSRWLPRHSGRRDERATGSGRRTGRQIRTKDDLEILSWAKSVLTEK